MPRKKKSVSHRSSKPASRKSKTPKYVYNFGAGKADGHGVMGVQKSEGEYHDPFESAIEHYKDARYGQHNIDDSKLTAADYQALVEQFKKLVEDRTGRAFPNDPWDQLKGAAGAVFGSWMNDRASVSRRKYNIPQYWGTAVNVQAMGYGNTGENSGSAVAFTRNPANDLNEF